MLNNRLQPTITLATFLQDSLINLNPPYPAPRLLKGVNTISRQMTPFLHLLFKCYALIYFIFAFQNLQNSVGSPTLNYFLVCKIHIYIPKFKLSRLLTWISFFFKKFTDFWYITCSAPNLISIWP